MAETPCTNPNHPHSKVQSCTEQHLDPHAQVERLKEELSRLKYLRPAILDAENKRLRGALEKAIKSVKMYRAADAENDKWRERHKNWPELARILADKEHLAVEALYDAASDLMDEILDDS